MSNLTLYCSVCGHGTFVQNAVLWQELIEQWALTADQAAYIDRQQGLQCKKCACTLRSIALASAMMQNYGYEGLFSDFVLSGLLNEHRILEVNEAGQLSPYLEKLPRHTRLSYPDIDLHHIGFADRSFELVVHSDTLEHVKDPVAALKEIHRILMPGGATLFTIPLIPERLSRSREGLPPCYHGSESARDDDYIVWTEFGADAWIYLARAGFARVSHFIVEYPAAIVLAGFRGEQGS
jgi:SAM-dependent methyltransferase